MKQLVIAALMILIGSAAYGGGMMLLHVGDANGNSSGPAATGKILLVDGVSFILQTDAVSKICRAGGC